MCINIPLVTELPFVVRCRHSKLGKVTPFIPVCVRENRLCQGNRWDVIGDENLNASQVKSRKRLSLSDTAYGILDFANLAKSFLFVKVKFLYILLSEYVGAMTKRSLYAQGAVSQRFMV